MCRWIRPAKWTSWCVLILMLFAAGFAVRQLPGIALQNSVHTWLSDDDPEALVLEWCRDRFPDQDQILISWDGSSLDDPRVVRLANVLAGTPHENGTRVGGLACIDDAVTPHELLAQMTRHGVDGSEAADRLRGVLVGRDRGTNSAVPVAVLATLSETGSMDHRESLDAIRRTAAECGIPPQTLHLGGDSVTSAALDAEVINATWNGIDPLRKPPVFLLSGLLGALLAAKILHSARLGAMVLACAWLTALVGTALVPFFGHSMNMVVIVMPTLLIVLALSAAIHLANYWKHAAASGHEHPVRAAIRMGWLPCLLAAVTTGIGLMSLSISSLGPIRDFGVFASVGTMISLFVVLGGLPAMMVVRPVDPPDRAEVDHPAWRWLGHFLARHCAAVGVITLLLVGAASGGLYWFRTEVKVARYFPEGSRLADDYGFLEEHLGGVAPVEVLVTFKDTPDSDTDFLHRTELVRRIQNGLRAHPEITGAISLADFQPVTEPLPDDAGFLTRSRYTVRTRAAEARVKQAEAASAATFLVADKCAGFDGWTPQSPLDEVWRIRAAAYVTSDSDYGELTTELKEIVTSSINGEYGVDFMVTGTVPLFFRAQQALLDSLIRSFCLAFGVIAVAMILLLRGVRAGVLSMLPTLMPIGTVFGAMSWCGQVLDIGTMLTASVALGISVDGLLHLLTWFRSAVAAGRSREDAVTYALQHCGPAMTQTSAVIGFSLLMLYPAELLLISRFGWVMATLIGMALAAEVVFLPVLLVGPLGRLIQRSVAPTNPSAEAARPFDDWNALVYRRRRIGPVWLQHVRASVCHEPGGANDRQGNPVSRVETGRPVELPVNGTVPFCPVAHRRSDDQTRNAA